MLKDHEEYFLGLDMGTASVGWAVTDVNYNLLRTKGKDMWGVRLFEEAKTAAERRTNRISRRRRQREVARIGLLRELFADEIQKVDPGFFQRLEDSKFYIEDKRETTPFSLFADTGYTDKEYYKQYPTIFHLRKELIESSQPHDVRLVYLAILNMYKHRGHFLSVNLDTSEKTDITSLYNKVCMVLNEYLDIILPVDIDTLEIENILSKKDISRSRMVEELAQFFGITKSKHKREYEIVKGICGLSVNIYVLFGADIVQDENKKISICFRDRNYEEKQNEVLELIGDDNYAIIDALKQIHDYGQVAYLMKGATYLSQARVNDYNKHKNDLKILKSVILRYSPETYDSMFREMMPGSYSAYINSVNSDEKKSRNVKGRKQEDLYKNIKSILKNMPENDKEVAYLTKEIENETLLPKQMTYANGVIPNQLHVSEMKAILGNASKYLPFLNIKDENNLTVIDKIVSIFTFNIPYYVGPLSEQHKNKGGNAWVVRKQSGKVYPWNFDNCVDVKKSAEEFISRMVRHCTYLSDEKALPKTSLLYEKYMVLNELNNLRIRGEKPSVELKQDIYKDLFYKGKKVKRMQLFKYLVARGVLNKDEFEAISGIDNDFVSSLSTIGKFSGVLGAQIEEDSTKKMVEKIVFWGTVYGNDKKFLKERITEVYGDKLSNDQIKRIVGFQFKDWGRLSREFLELSGCDKSTGESMPLIRMLWERNENTMELLSNRYTFYEELEDKTKKIQKSLSELEYEDLDDLYLSAPVKRMIWQTILVIKDIEQTIGYEPKRVFVEMARGNGKPGERKDSRKKKLLDLYKGCKVDGRDWCKEISSYDEARLRSKKLYLYYTQRGRCMYTGEPIDIQDLFNDNLYDIDHIYPRHYVKDDSIENNLVLVKKKINARKSDSYPIENSIFKANHAFWKSLLSSKMTDGLITREKYNRLVHRDPFTEEQLAGFISRQLVETRQGTKTITKILNEVFTTSETVFVKAENVSNFRHDTDLIKCRDVNDFHHAEDAYLNVVVGNTYYTKFTRNPINFIHEYIKNPSENKYHMSSIFNYTVQRNGEVAWLYDKENPGNGTIKIVKNVMRKNTPLITRMNYEAHGGIANQTLYGADSIKEDGYIPLKTKDIRMHNMKKYGGYSSVTIAYFFLVEHEKKGRTVRSLEAMPLYLKDSVGRDIKCMEEYCINVLGLVNPSIRIKCIKLQSLIKRDHFYYNITGKSNNAVLVRNAVPLCLKRKWYKYIRMIEKAVETGFVSEDITSSRNIEFYRLLLNKHTDGIYASRINPVGERLISKEEMFLHLSVKEQCIVLCQILQLSQLTNTGADLTLLGEAKASGKMRMGKDISVLQELKLINQSPTGLHCNEIDLLTV